MRLFYVDSGLRGDIGHHANYCRTIASELSKRDVPITIIGFAGIDESLRAELGVLPLLRTYIYYLSDGDPLAGWLNAFEQVSHVTRQDMARITGVTAEDIVYIASAFPGQLMGAIRWLGDLPPHNRPLVLVDLLSHPGIEVRHEAPGYVFRPRREDPRAMLYRYAAQFIARSKIERLVVAYADRVGADIYSKVLGVAVTPLPSAFEAVTRRRNRAGCDPFNLAFLGSQRNEEKGYHLVPELVVGLLQSHPTIRIRVHNSCPGNFPAASDAVRKLAAVEPRMVLDERAVDLPDWAQLLDTTDLMVCPYSHEIYEFMSSGVHAEAIANAIPSVVPAGTALSRALQEFGGGGTTFERFESSSILTATRHALDHFDQYAENAWAGSNTWLLNCGPARLVDTILKLSQH